VVIKATQIANLLTLMQILSFLFRFALYRCPQIITLKTCACMQWDLIWYNKIFVCVIKNPMERLFLRWLFEGTYKVPNEIETKRNETKSTKPKRNETKRNQRNKTKPTKAKRNQRKQNEIDWYDITLTLICEDLSGFRLNIIWSKIQASSIKALLYVTVCCISIQS
jgi:hypothetical protein